MSANERLLATIERTLNAPRTLPAFPAELEARFEADMREPRVRRLRLAIVLGLIVFLIYGSAYFVTAPDVAFLDLGLRLGVMTPIALGIWWAVGHVDGRTREALCGLGMLTAAGIPILAMGLGGGSLVSLSAPAIWLTVIFGNVSLPLRFPWACVVSGATALAAFIVLMLKGDLSAGVSAVIQLDMTVGILISLVASHQIETAQRRGYLLSLREMLRSRRLVADNTTLARLSTTDPLTGLANRRAFAYRLDTLWRNARAGRPFAMLLIDVDHFKRFNDLYGHGAGDACLCEVADVLKEHAPSGDELVARYGGEEFAVLLPGLDNAGAIALAERVRVALNARDLPHAGRGDGLGHVTVSVGVAASSDAVPSPAALVEAADAALYQAKSAGRNRIGPAAAHGPMAPASAGLVTWLAPERRALRRSA